MSGLSSLGGYKYFLVPLQFLFLCSSASGCRGFGREVLQFPLMGARGPGTLVPYLPTYLSSGLVVVLLHFGVVEPSSSSSWCIVAFSPSTYPTCYRPLRYMDQYFRFIPNTIVHDAAYLPATSTASTPTAPTRVSLAISNTT